MKKFNELFVIWKQKYGSLGDLTGGRKVAYGAAEFTFLGRILYDLGFRFFMKCQTNSRDQRSKITQVAIRFRGTIHSLPAPNRHHDVIRKIVENDPSVTCVDARDEDQGFLDADGRYLTRRQALHNAQVNGQIKPGTKIRFGQLFSEDVW